MNNDFISFELAIKLQEKGFPQHQCDYAYIIEENHEDIEREYVSFIPDYLPTVAAPTISQVLKWLREEKKIHITVLLLWEGYYAEVFTKVRWKTDDTHQRGLCFNIDKCIYKNETYEAAALAGIEYVLDNLI